MFAIVVVSQCFEVDPGPDLERVGRPCYQNSTRKVSNLDSKYQDLDPAIIANHAHFSFERLSILRTAGPYRGWIGFPLGILL